MQLIVCEHNAYLAYMLPWTPAVHSNKLLVITNIIITNIVILIINNNNNNNIIIIITNNIHTQQLMQGRSAHLVWVVRVALEPQPVRRHLAGVI